MSEIHGIVKLLARVLFYEKERWAKKEKTRIEADILGSYIIIDSYNETEVNFKHT